MDILVLYVLLSPLILWNKVTWKQEHTEHFQQTLEDFEAIETEADIAYQKYQNDLAAWWSQ